MKKVLFLGTEHNGYWVADVAAEFGCDIEYSGFLVSPNEMIDKALSVLYDYIVIDISELYISGADLEFTIKQILTGSTASVCVIAQGMPSGSVGVSTCISAGVKNICNSLYVGELRKEMQYFFKGESNAEMVATQTNGLRDVIKHKPIKNINTARKTIAVAGSVDRIGTTTQALQIVKFLQMNGKKTAYIEANSTGYINDLLNTQSGAKVEDDVIGWVTLYGIDMFYNLSQIENIYKMGYEYLVFDFGSMQDENFQEIPFYEKDIKITVHGYSPSELKAFDRCINKLYPRNVIYLFSFVPNSERENVIEMMDDRSDKTYFAAYTPNPYSYSSENAYSTIIPIEGKEENKEERLDKKRKFGLFGKKRKKGSDGGNKL